MKILMQARSEINRNGALIPVDVVGTLNYYVDTSYGDDADGNRGERRTVVDEVRDIYVWDDEANALKISEWEQEMLAQTLTEKFLGR